MRVKIII